MAAKNHIDLVINTLAVLECLASGGNGKPLKQIADEVGLVKSSAFRILFTLKEAGYVEQPESNGIYRLTLKTAGLSRRNAHNPTLTSIARPHLLKLRDTLDESVALAERRADDVVLVDVLETSHPLRLSFHIGDKCPIHATALGKAVAAFLPTDELTAMVSKAGLPQYTARTKTKRLQLKAELALTRKHGYTTNNEETVVGAFLVGAPVFDLSGSVCGAISVNTPTARCSEKRREVLVAAVTEAGLRITADLADSGFVQQLDEGAA